MQTIHKYELKFPPKNGDAVNVDMPIGAEILTAREQGDSICVWALVDPSKAKIPRFFQVFGTGWEIRSGEERKFLGTAFLGGLVFHVFERVRILPS
jgi:hypothetical protein